MENRGEPPIINIENWGPQGVTVGPLPKHLSVMKQDGKSYGGEEEGDDYERQGGAWGEARPQQECGSDSSPMLISPNEDFSEDSSEADIDETLDEQPSIEEEFEEELLDDQDEGILDMFDTTLVDDVNGDDDDVEVVFVVQGNEILQQVARKQGTVPKEPVGEEPRAEITEGFDHEAGATSIEGKEKKPEVNASFVRTDKDELLLGVSVGFECRTPSRASETESEGELVPCEDKCVGTGDTVEDWGLEGEGQEEPLDLSVSEKEDTVKEKLKVEETKYDSEVPRDVVVQIPIGATEATEAVTVSLPAPKEEEEVSKGIADALKSEGGKGGKNGTTKKKGKCKTTGKGKNNATGLAMPANVEETFPDGFLHGGVDEVVGKSESEKETAKLGKKGSKKKGRKSKRDGNLEAKEVGEVNPEVLLRPKLVRGRAWKDRKAKPKDDGALKISFGEELCQSEIVESTSSLVTDPYTETNVMHETKGPGSGTMITTTTTTTTTINATVPVTLGSDVSHTLVNTTDFGTPGDGGDVRTVVVSTYVKPSDVANVMPGLKQMECSNECNRSDTACPECDHCQRVPALVMPEDCVLTPDNVITVDNVSDDVYGHTRNSDLEISKSDVSSDKPGSVEKSCHPQGLVSLVPATTHEVEIGTVLPPPAAFTGGEEESDLGEKAQGGVSETAEGKTPEVSSDSLEGVDPFQVSSPGKVKVYEFDSKDSSKEEDNDNDESKAALEGPLPLTQSPTKLNLVYNYEEFDDSDFEGMSSPRHPQPQKQVLSRRQLPPPPPPPSVAATPSAQLTAGTMLVVNVGEDRGDLESVDTDSLPDGGDIVYQGPCLCGTEGVADGGRGALRDKDDGDEDEGFVMDGEANSAPGERDTEPVFPSLFDSDLSFKLDTVRSFDMSGESQPVERDSTEIQICEIETSGEQDSMEAKVHPTVDTSDIRHRIDEIVGGRLQRRTENVAVPRGFENSLQVPEGPDGESPLPGSSPASSSGVQGSDEMSPSQSRSRSRDVSVSPRGPKVSNTGDTAAWVADASSQHHQQKEQQQQHQDPEQLLMQEQSRRVDRNIRALRDLYQFNPSYLTDSEEEARLTGVEPLGLDFGAELEGVGAEEEDEDDLNESETLVQGSSVSHSCDLDYTMTGFGSASEESPNPFFTDPSLTPPYPLSSASLTFPKVTASHSYPPPPAAPTRVPRKVTKATRMLKETQGIVQRWEVLQTQALERQRLSSQVRELQKRVKSLRLAFEALADRAAAASRDCKSREDLRKSLEEVRECLCNLEEHKAELSSVNLYVHRFLTETGYSLNHLKEDVADLYRVYDETFKRINAEASRLDGVENSWLLWEAQAEELTKALRHDHDTLTVLDTAIQTGSLNDSVTASVQDVAKLLNERRRTQSGKKINLQATRTQGVDIQGSSTSLTQSGDECYSDSGTSGYESCSSEELSERERRLAHLRRLARDLETVLQPHSAAWANITKTISAAESELRGLQKHCRELVMRTAETLEQTRSTSPQLRRRGWGKEAKGARNVRAERRGVTLGGRDSSSTKSGSSWRRGGWVWRVVRAALPFQAALLLLFCVACLLEPNCCDHVNTLNLSLSPQLRYVHGPPPV